MTDEQIIIEVAKLDGFINIKELHPAITDNGYIWIGVDNRIHTVKRVPFYLISRDAIIPVIEKQTNEIKQKLLHWLFTDSSLFNPTLAGFGVNHALYLLFCTPKQLCIALLKATGEL